jgi:Protein of unknown function (DUF2589)
MDHPESISNVYSLDELFAIPLKAVIDANAYAVKTALEFILTFGFDGPVAKLHETNESIGSPRTVTFTYDYTDARGQTQVTKVSVPLISLIPMPLLEVTKAHFDYAIQILHGAQVTVQTSDNSTVENNSLLAVLAPLDTAQEHHRKLARESSLKANMTVHVEVEKSDLPAGILQLLNFGQQAIRGVMEEKLVIHTEPDKLLFDHKDLLTAQPPYKVRVEIRKPLKLGSTSNVHTDGVKASAGEIVHNKAIQIYVSSKTGGLANLFTHPISVGAGHVIGTPTYSRAAALTNEDGLVEFALWPDLSVSNNHNGFIVIKTQMADDKALYFGFI